MSSSARDAPEVSFHAILYADRHNLAIQAPAIHARLGDAYFDSHGENPDTREGSPCFFCLCSQEHEIVSFIHGFADTLTIDGVDYPWMWTGDLQTLEAWRRRGFASQLQERSTAYVQSRGISRGSVFSTDVTLSIYGKLGYRLPGYAPRYLQLRSPRPLVEGHLRNRWARTIARGIAWPVWTLGNAALQLVNRSRLRIADFVEVNAGDSGSLRELCQRIAAVRRLHFNLSVEKLNWKVRQSARSGGRTVVYLLMPRRGTAPIGYAVVRLRRQMEPLAERYKDFEMLSLMDYALVDETAESHAALLSNVVELGARHGADVVEFVSPAVSLRKAAKAFGMLPAGRGMSFSYLLAPECSSGDLAVERVETWHVNHYSGDGLSQ